MADTEFKRIVNIKYRPAVLVCGGGVAGLCAALAAARGGADTMLIERSGCCGGMATSGLVAPFMTCYDSGGGKRLLRGLFTEIVECMKSRGGALEPEDIPAASAFTSYIGPGHLHVTPFDAECLKATADEMLCEAGVKVLYHTVLSGVEASDGKVTRVIVTEKGGLCAIEPDIVIDCTGDGDAAAAAGAGFTCGDGKGRIQPATMFFRIGNVDSAAVEADIIAHKDMFYRRDGVNYRSFHWRVAEARQAGDWTLRRVSIGMFRGVREDEWSINTSRIMGVDGTDSESLTEAEMEGRRQVDEIFRFLVKYVPGCERARLLASASTVGIRETRHIHGLATLTAQDVLGGVIPEDAVLVCANSIDIHGKFGPMSNEYITLPPGVMYGIPYRCLVVRGFDNLLVAGRCLSAESDAAGAVRVMPPCMAMGQAAGTAAALALNEGESLPGLEYGKLKKKLLDGGVYLGD